MGKRDRDETADLLPYDALLRSLASSLPAESKAAKLIHRHDRAKAGDSGDEEEDEVEEEVEGMFLLLRVLREVRV